MRTCGFSSSLFSTLEHKQASSYEIFTTHCIDSKILTLLHPRCWFNDTFTSDTHNMMVLAGL
jgi:hypothetical protein